MTPKILICLSGGADSVTALYESVAHLGPQNVAAIMFNYKSAHNSAELLFGRGHCLRLGVQFRTEELPPLGGLTKKNWNVPWRNTIFIALAGNMAEEIGADSIILGCNKDDADYPFLDCTPKYFKAMNRVAKILGYKVEILTPYIEKRKWEIMAIAREHGVPLHELWTCYQPKDGQQCGECPACKKLQAAIAHK